MSKTKIDVWTEVDKRGIERKIIDALYELKSEKCNGSHIIVPMPYTPSSKDSILFHEKTYGTCSCGKIYETSMMPLEHQKQWIQYMKDKNLI